MPCDTVRSRGQTVQQRAEEIKAAQKRIEALLARPGVVKITIGKGGGINFDGISEKDRDGLTDVCIYQRIMATGSASAKIAIARAQQAAGVRINPQSIAAGVHSHDRGATWHGRG